MDYPLNVVMYSRPGCRLCDEVKSVMETAGVAIDLTVVNVDEFEALRARFGTDVPVVYINGYKSFKHRIDVATFRAKAARLARYRRHVDPYRPPGCL